MSEDCLYLNVWTPATSANEHLPVLVWIPGGGFAGGATSSPHQSGNKLARRGVVLVSIACRLGPFGFLAHPDLSAESEYGVSGNYGLLDMVAGLEWKKRNIAAFGGDPGRVTILGESAGGTAVSMLCASPMQNEWAPHTPPMPGLPPWRNCGSCLPTRYWLRAAASVGWFGRSSTAG